MEAEGRGRAGGPLAACGRVVELEGQGKAGQGGEGTGPGVHARDGVLYMRPRVFVGVGEGGRGAGVCVEMGWLRSCV